MTSEALLHPLSLWPNILGWFYLWYDMSDLYWLYVHLGWCWYLGALVYPPPGCFSQIDYQLLASVFKRKFVSVFTRWYHLFQLQEKIYFL